MKHINIKTAGLIIMASGTLSACTAADRLSKIGLEPEITPIENPQLQADYKPISMPMPAPEVIKQQPNSLWASNRKNFFDDQRAGDVGDILTVMIDIKDEAALDNESERKRTSTEKAGLDNILGYEGSLGAVLPEAVAPSTLVGGGANSGYKGEGTVEREEEIKLKLAAIITQILPNGNLVIHGKQEARVNFEKRIIQIDGVIRPQDISIENTISHEQIAEARISYGGEGQITDVQQPRYGQQVYDILFPF